MGLKEYTGAVVTIAAVVAAFTIIVAYLVNPVPALKDIAIFAVGALVGALTSANKKYCFEVPPGSKVHMSIEEEG